MGDETVEHVMAFLSDTAFANGVDAAALHSLVDAIVGRMRQSGMPDSDITHVFDVAE